LKGAGTATDGLVFGGTIPPFSAITEVWDGSSWTEVADLNTARSAMGASGSSSTDALAFGGYGPGTTVQALTEYYNGTAWTEVSDLATGRYILAGAGTTSSALGFGGYSTARVGTTEEWTVDAVVSTITTS